MVKKNMKSTRNKTKYKVIIQWAVKYYLMKYCWVLKLFGIHPCFWYGNHTDIHRSVVFRQHRRLNFDFFTIRTHGRMRMICSALFMSCREQFHFMRFPVNEINAPRKIVANRPFTVWRTANMPKPATCWRLPFNSHFPCP